MVLQLAEVWVQLNVKLNLPIKVWVICFRRWITLGCWRKYWPDLATEGYFCRSQTLPAFTCLPTMAPMGVPSSGTIISSSWSPKRPVSSKCGMCRAIRWVAMCRQSASRCYVEKNHLRGYSFLLLLHSTYLFRPIWGRHDIPSWPHLRIGVHHPILLGDKKNLPWFFSYIRKFTNLENIYI